MKNKPGLKMLFAVFSLILIGSTGALAQKETNKKIDCAQVADKEVVLAVYDKIKAKYADQIRHINVRVSADKVVTIEGWTTTKSVKKDIEKMAKKIKCVKSIVNKLTIGIGGGCGPGQKQCGDICIYEKETCNICLVASDKGCLEN
jgi:osmotically-inducible protein OsmY